MLKALNTIFKERTMALFFPQIRNVTVMLFGLFLLLTVGCGPRLYKEAVPTIQAPPQYDNLYPYYVELCAVSQIRAKFAPHGGSPGHAVMYLKGVCRDHEAAFPTIKVCDAGSVDLRDPETGVGISVNKLLKNVNWIAVPGKRLFFGATLRTISSWDKSHARSTIQAAEGYGDIRRGRNS